MSVVHVVEAGESRADDADTHADLPKHAFGSCAICTRRLLAQKQARSAPRLRRAGTAMPTRFLVQTSVVPSAKDGQA